jgi:hypothetical protein
MKTPKLDLCGKQFGHIKVIRKAGNVRKWVGVCDCNPQVEREFNGSRLARGKITHCGCERTSHGHTARGTRTPTYLSWQDMKARRIASKYIGADGKTRYARSYSKRWLKFDNFLADMGERPPGKTLDRIDTLGHYVPDNCRWATRIVQDYNKTNTKRYWADPETKEIVGSALEWAEWLSKHTGVAMTVAEFRILIKFFTVEQLYCAVSPLVSVKQLRQMVQEQKEKEFAAKWAQAEREAKWEPEDTGWVPDDCDIEDTGQIED